MLNSLRDAAGTWVAKLLLILLVLSFAVWGISGSMFGGMGSHVVRAGDTNVSIMEYRLAYDRQLSIMSQQFGMPITREQAQAFGVDQQVLSQLIGGAVLDEQARQMNLGLSRDRLAILTAEDPAFAGPDGRFNRQQFDYVLRQIGMRPEDYLRSREQVAIRQQIVEAVSDGLKVPDAFLRAFSLYQGEDRTADYLVLPKSLVEPVEPPSDAVLSTFFEENKANYAAPEYRSISYVKLEPTDIADPAVITDEQARQYYDANRGRYGTPERRRIEQLVFANQDEANAALEKIRGGATFEEIVTEQGRSLNDVALGTFDRAGIADPAIAEAAFSLPQGQVSDVVPGSFGPILLRVTEIVPESVRPFEEVASEIRQELALDEASRVLMDVYDSYEDARASGDTMAQAAEKQRLRVVTIDAVDSSGRTPDGTQLTNLPESAQLLSQAFEADTGVENAPINLGSNGYLFYEVNEIDPAHDRTLDEVRDRVVADWTARETGTRLAARAAELQQEIDGGKALAEIATELELEVQTRRGLKRDSSDGTLGQTGVAAIFGVAKDHAGIVAAPDGESQILFRVSEVLLPMGAGAESVPENQREAFSSGLANDLLDQLVTRLQSQYDVTIDRGAIQQALSF